MQKEKLIELVQQGLSMKKIADLTGLATSTVAYWLKKYEIATLNTIKISHIWAISDEDFIKNVAESMTYRELCSKCGLKSHGNNNKTVQRRIKIMGLTTDHFQKCYDVSNKTNIMSKEDFVKRLTKESLITTGSLKRFILKFNLLPHKCDCGIDKEWLGKPISLQLDHIDGDKHNNEIQNLRFICPNCHSQTKTFAGRNLRKYTNFENLNTEKYKQMKSKMRYVPCSCGEKKSDSAKYCRRCMKSDTKRPDMDTLKSLLSKHSMTKISTMYGVSPPTVRRWRNFYKIEDPGFTVGHWLKEHHKNKNAP